MVTQVTSPGPAGSPPAAVYAPGSAGPESYAESNQDSPNTPAGYGASYSVHSPPSRMSPETFASQLNASSFRSSPEITGYVGQPDHPSGEGEYEPTHLPRQEAMESSGLTTGRQKVLKSEKKAIESLEVGPKELGFEEEARIFFGSHDESPTVYTHLVEPPKKPEDHLV